MKQIELKHTATRTIKEVFSDLNNKRVLLWFTDNTFVVLQAVHEDDYEGSGTTYINDDNKFDPTDFYQAKLVEAGFLSQEELDKKKAERDKVWQAKQRKEGLLQYRQLAEYFGSLDQYKPEDFGETEMEHELKRRMARINGRRTKTTS